MQATTKEKYIQSNYGERDHLSYQIQMSNYVLYFPFLESAHNFGTIVNCMRISSPLFVSSTPVFGQWMYLTALFSLGVLRKVPNTSIHKAITTSILCKQFLYTYVLW